MALFALVEAAPTAPKPTNSACMYPTSTQATTDGNLVNTKWAAPGTVGGGAGANTYRFVQPGANNATTTDQGEPNNTTVTGFGWVLTPSSGGVLTPVSSIAAGTWTIRLSTGAVTYTGTFQYGIRFWQISNDRSTKTLISLTGADASGWVFSGTQTPSASGAIGALITLSSMSAVTFGASTPYLYLEIIVKVITVGASTATIAMHAAQQNVTVPAVSYAMTASDTLGFSDAAAQTSFRSRTAGDTLTFTDSASQTSFRSRTGADTLTFADTATRQVLSVRAAPDTLSLTDAATRSLVNGRASADTLTLADAASRVVVNSRAASDTTSLTDSSKRSVVTSRSAADATSLSDSSSRSVRNTRSATDTTSLTDSAFRVVMRARTASDTISLSDTASRLVASARFAADALVLTDTARRSVVVTRAAADTSTFSDTATRVVLSIRTALDQLATGGGGGTTIIGRPTTLRRMGGSVPLTPGQIVPIEPAWYDNNGNPVSPTGATVTFRDFSTGSARYWTGTGWTSTPTSLPTTSGRYVLTVPTAWLGLVVAVTASLAGQQDLTDTYTVDDTVSSRATSTALAAVQADTDDIQASLAARLDATVSSRASATALAAVQADTDDLQASLVTVLNRLDVAVSTRSSSSDMASALADLALLVTRVDVATSTRASGAAVTALGSPAQGAALADVQADTDALQTALAALATTVGTPAQAVALTTAYLALLAEIDTRARPEDVQTTVNVDASDLYGGRVG